MRKKWRKLQRIRRQNLKTGIPEQKTVSSHIDPETEDGRKEGRAYALIEAICKKLRRGKSAEIIAEELEEELLVIESIIRSQRRAGSYEAERIYEDMRQEGIPHPAHDCLLHSCNKFTLSEK